MGNVHFTASGYCYRCPFGLEYPSCDVRCARDAEGVIQSATAGRIAAFIAEPIQGVGGFITPPPEYFSIVYEIVKRYGGVTIADEVQDGSPAVLRRLRREAGARRNAGLEVVNGSGSEGLPRWPGSLRPKRASFPPR